MSSLDLQEMQRLLRTVEEATRSTKEGVKNFVEPAHGTLDRVTSRRHHIVFGRRGSGKSSLLEKAAADLTVDRRPIAKVDLEAFKGHAYPDVLLSVLIRTFREFQGWLDTAAVHPASRRRFWTALFGQRPTRKALPKGETTNLSKDIGDIITTLEAMLRAPDHASMNLVTAKKSEGNAQLSGSAKVGIKGAGAEVAVVTGSRESTEQQAAESSVRSKIDFLHHNILTYQDLFRRMATVSQGDSFLLLDDLYHIRRSDQARVLDYFHRIAKGNNLWLKIGTIRHRTQWYLHGDPPTGLKLGDDADEINLDLTLERYSIAKDFLFRILGKFASDSGLDLADFLTDGARDRLVLASGGVARDFLSIFRRSVEVARERSKGDHTAKITVEDVNMASGEYDSSKREEFRFDTLDDQNELQQAFDRVKDFCIETSGTNCFLVNVDKQRPELALIHELVDLKLLHLVRSRVTVGNIKYKGRIFEAYMLDLSQYTGTRKRREFRIVEFWKSDATEELRRASLIYRVA